MKSKTTIEVNGKHYDAVTGAIIKSGSVPTVRTGQNIDGFFRSRTTITPTTKSSAVVTPPISDKFTVLAAPTPAPKPHRPGRGTNHAHAHAPQPAKVHTVRIQSDAPRSQKLTVHRTPSAPNHAQAHTTQHSQTLMRTAVTRPEPSFHKQVGTVGSLQHAVPSLIVPKKAAAAIDEDRLARAQSANRSPQISHHSDGTSHKVQPLFAPLAVQPVPVKPEGEVPSTTPSPQPNNKPGDIFEHALANAEHFVDIHAHRTHFKKKARMHVASMAAGTLALLFIAGFAAYQNTPGIQFKVASVQAGVSTHMPNLSAAGFAYNGVKASDGKLMVGFSGTSGNYQLTQENTNLSGSDVVQNIGATDASGTPDYQAIQAGGTTVYRFNGTDATWVNGGKWYTVTGTGSLTDNQVRDLVQNI